MRRWTVPKGVKIGTGSYFASMPTIRWNKYGSKLIVGKYTSISTNLTVLLGGHHYTDRITTYQLTRGGKSYRRTSYSKGDVNIGSDVWIGDSVTILDGVTIGDGAVVGACSVVASDVEPYHIVAGNPARPIRWRFSLNIIEKLLKIRWWDWPREKILAAKPLLESENIERFLQYARELCDVTE